MKRCKTCHRRFEPKVSSLQATCSPDCAIQYARLFPQRRATDHQRAAKVERKDHRKAKQELRTRTMSISKLKQGADREFGRFIRERDFSKPCICCGRYASAESIRRLAVTGHLWDAGHYRSKGAADHLRYNENNCHAQLVVCNRDRSGNHVEYRKGLIMRIGVEQVEALENDNSIHKWTREELVQIRRTYLAKWKVMRAAREQRAA